MNSIKFYEEIFYLISFKEINLNVLKIKNFLENPWIVVRMTVTEDHSVDQNAGNPYFLQKVGRKRRGVYHYSSKKK